MSYDRYGEHGGRGYENTRQGAYGRTQSYDGRGYQDRGAEPHGYGREHERGYEQHRGGYDRGGDDYGMGMSRGELREFIVQVLREQTEEMFAEQGFYRGGKGGRGGHDDELHERYKEVLEELREIPSAMEATKQFSKHFEGLTEEDRKVLTQLIQRPPLKKMAQNAGVSPEKFWQLKHELMYKLKRQ